MTNKFIETFKKNGTILILVVVMVIGFYFRIYGLDCNYSFWTDEDHAAIFTRQF